MQVAMVAAGDNQVAGGAQLQILLGVAEEAALVSLLQGAHLLHLLRVAQLQLLLGVTERPALVSLHFPTAGLHPHCDAYSSFPSKTILAT